MTTVSLNEVQIGQHYHIEFGKINAHVLITSKTEDEDLYYFEGIQYFSKTGNKVVVGFSAEKANPTHIFRIDSVVIKK